MKITNFFVQMKRGPRQWRQNLITPEGEFKDKLGKTEVVFTRFRSEYYSGKCEDESLIVGIAGMKARESESSLMNQ